MNIFTDLIYPIAGFLLVSIGAGWIYRPLGLIVAGSLLLLISFGRRTKPNA